MTQTLKIRVIFEGHFYDVRIVVDAPKEEGQLILQLIHKSLRTKGVIP